jgi:glycosyltransferase involved in cell wall biosynthesis
LSEEFAGRPQVTVLMPVFNGARHLRSAVDSILSQTFTDFELLIVNDGSTDDSRAILSRYADRRLRVIDHERNLGLSAALNRGLQEAHGELVARQDQDDLAMPERLAQQAAFLASHGEFSLVGARGRVIDDNGEFIGIVDRPLDNLSVRWYSLWNNPFIHTAVMFRRSDALDAGGYEAQFDPFSQDYALWSRMLASHKAANLPDRLIHYRVSDISATGSMSLPELAGADPKRARFVPIARQIIGRNLRAAFGRDAISDDDVVRASGLVLGLSAEEVPEFLRLFFRLLDRFQANLTKAEREGLRATIARQLDTLAYRAAASDRRAAISIYAAAARRDPWLLFELPWPRVLVLTVCGASGRGAIKRLSVFRRMVAPYL